MSTWRTGQFEREKLSGLFRPFAPAHAVESLLSIEPQELWGRGKRLILLDVDNTLVEWRQENFAQPVLDWIAHAKQLGFHICILSNTRRIKRLERIKNLLGVDAVRGRFKPSTAMYRLALITFGCSRDQAVMIGDQMLTDVLGANRAGIEAIWVARMDRREFTGTKVNRLVERMLSSAIYKVLVLPEERAPLETVSPAVREATVIEQIVRFALVGGISFAIDYGLTTVLMHWIHVGGEEMGVAFGKWVQRTVPLSFVVGAKPDHVSAPFLGGAASLLAMVNSFILNRAWTFEAHGKDRKSTQIARFFTVSILGACINAMLFGGLYSALPGEENRRTLFAKAIAAAIVAVWNFLGQRQFAFRARRGGA